MKRLLLCLLLLAPIPLAAQVGTGPVIRLSGIPSGTCPANRLYLNIATGTLYSCVAGTWTAFGSSVSIQSLGTLTAADQVFAVSTTGTDFTISSATATHTFNLPSASATARGLVTTGTQTFAGAKTFSGHLTVESVTSTGATGTGKFVFDTSPVFATSAISPLFRSTSAKVLVQGTGTGATQLAATQTTVPTCSSNCGTSPSVAGSDTFMTVTMGATGTPASGWVVTFNGTWAAAPACVVQSGKSGMVVGKMPIVVVTSTTTITVTTNGTAPDTGDVYQIHCGGTQ